MVEYTFKQSIDLMRSILSPYREKKELDSNGNTIYFGQCRPSGATSEAVWRIQKWTYDGNGFFNGIVWADGTDQFIKVWDDRASYTYASD